MKKIFALLIGFVLFSSHDMYLKLDTYFLQPNTAATIQLYNGTFDKSENVIDRNRMIDVSLVGHGNRIAVDTTQWSERDSMTILSFKTGDAGTWVAGVSTRARNIEMAAADFNGYLEHDGVLDMLEWRKNNSALDQDAIEKYSKHVKTIFQVGDQTTNDWQTALGYPIEFVPLNNPYDLEVGESFEVQLLWQGQPLVNQLVLVDSGQPTHTHDQEGDHDHSHADDHEHGSDHDHADNHSHDNADDHDHEHSDEHEHADDHEHGSDHDHADNHSHDNADNHDHEHSDAHEHGSDHDHADNHSHDHADDHEHTAEKEATHSHTTGTPMRTDADGKLAIQLESEGVWFLRTIHMALSEEAGLTHESNWATLTFEIGHGHSHADGSHSHDHEHEDGLGIPSYVFYGGSLALLLGLFLWFNRKK